MQAAVPGLTRRMDGDGGSALVEAAFVTPVLMFLLLGIFETAFSFLDYLALGSANRGGVRVAAIAGNDARADWQIVQAVLKNASAMKQGDLKLIVIYEASGSTSTVPTGCAAGTPSSATGSRCNVYQPADFTAALGSSTYGCGATANDRYWCPTVRKTALQGSNGPPGWIGVYVSSTHQYLTRLFGTSIVLRSDSVTRFEPDSLQ